MSCSRALVCIAVFFGLDLACRAVAAQLATTPPAAFAQAAPADPSPGHSSLVAIQGPGNLPWVFVHDPASGRLLAYEATSTGLALRGARELTYDLKLVELPADLATKRLTVKQIHDLVK